MGPLDKFLIKMILALEDVEPGALQNMIRLSSTKRGAERLLRQVNDTGGDVGREDIESFEAWLRDVAAPALSRAREEAALRPGSIFGLEPTATEPSATVVQLRA